MSDTDAYELQLRRTTARNRVIVSVLTLLVAVPFFGWRVMRLVGRIEQASAPEQTGPLGFTSTDRSALNAAGADEVVKTADMAESILRIYGTLPADACERYRKTLTEASAKPLEPAARTALAHVDTGLRNAGCR